MTGSRDRKKAGKSNMSVSVCHLLLILDSGNTLGMFPTKLSTLSYFLPGSKDRFANQEEDLPTSNRESAPCLLSHLYRDPQKVIEQKYFLPHTVLKR